MGKPAARITDMHTCPMVTPGTPPIPHVGGPIIPPCSIDVLTGKLPQARVTDKAICVGPPDVIVLGSSGVFVNNLPAARMGDTTAHGGVIVKGEPTVLIGETGGGGAGSPSMSAGAGMDGTVSLAFVAFQAQVNTLVQAHKSGAPFCEVCFKAATQALQNALP